MQTFSFVLAKKHAHSSREWKHLFWLKKHAHSSREWKHPIHHQYLLLDTLLDTLLDKSSTLANNKLLLLRMLAVLMLALRVKTRLRKPSLRWRTNARNVSSCFLDFLYLNWNYQRLSWWTGNSRLSESFTSAAPQFLSKLLLLLYYSLSWITYSNRKWRTYVLGYNLCFFSLELWSLKKKKKSSLLPPTVTLIEESFVFLHNKTINHMNIIFISFKTINRPSNSCRYWKCNAC